MFIAALFTKSKVWEQPKRPSVDERTKKMPPPPRRHTHTRALNIIQPQERTEILPIWMTWMDPDSIMLSEIS